MSAPGEALSLMMAALVVPDYDAAIAFYVGALGFVLVEDTPLGAGKRWVVVTPCAAGAKGGESGARLLLAKASDERQSSAIGNQTGGRVAFFLHTQAFDETYARFTAAGVTFAEVPRQEPYGTVAVFSDPFGNCWDLIQPKA